MSKIKLLSADNEIIEVDRSVANMSAVIRGEICDPDSVAWSAKSFPSKVIRKIEEFCMHHVHPPPLDRPDVVPEWDRNFFNAIEHLNEFAMYSGYAICHFGKAGVDLQIDCLESYTTWLILERLQENQESRAAAAQTLVTAFDRLGATTEEQA